METSLASQVALEVKNLPANAGDARAAGVTPGSPRSPGGGNGNPLPYSCLENSVDGGACLRRLGGGPTVHGVAELDTTKHLWSSPLGRQMLLPLEGRGSNAAKDPVRPGEPHQTPEGRVIQLNK